MGEVVPIIFLAVILKIPVLYGVWLIYWAVKDEPQVEDLPGEADDHSFRRFRRSPTKPRGPRRGPHGGGASVELPGPDGGRTRTPSIKPRLAPGVAAHERREHTPAGS
jgi:hypothetical protein